MKEFILYLEKNEIHVWDGKVDNNYKLIDFYKCVPKGKAILILSDQDLKYKIVKIPKDQKTDIAKVMLFESMELLQISNSDVMKKEYVYNWRIIHENEEERVYILYIMPSAPIIDFMKKCREKGLIIIEVVSLLDLLIQVCQKLGENFFGGFLVFLHNLIYFLTIDKGVYVFHRKFEIPQKMTDEHEELENFILELRRSIFYSKQRYKFEIKNLNILFCSNELFSILENIKEDIGIDSISITDVNMLSKCIPISLWTNYKKQLLSVTSFLPYEFLLEKRIARFSLLTNILCIVLFIVSVNFLFTKIRSYDYELTLLNKVIQDFNDIKRKKIEVEKRYNRFDNKVEKLKFVKNFFQENGFVYPFFSALPYLIPDSIYIEKIDFKKDKIPMLIISGKIEEDSILDRSSKLQEFISNLTKSILISSVELDTRQNPIETGNFQLKITLVIVTP